MNIISEILNKCKFYIFLVFFYGNCIDFFILELFLEIYNLDVIFFGKNKINFDIIGCIF